jgi:hypothetical protein
VCKGRRKEGGRKVEQVRHSQQTPAPAINIRTGVTKKPEIQEVPMVSVKDPGFFFDPGSGFFHLGSKKPQIPDPQQRTEVF